MLYKYCSTDGFDILVNHRLKLKKFKDFNDPFELVFGIDEDTALSNIRKEYEENPEIINVWKIALDKHGLTYDKTSSDDILEKITDALIKDFTGAREEMLEDLNDKWRIVCFSKSPDVIQMWAHYTDNHKGIVVGIEESEFLEHMEHVDEVCYQDKMVLLPVSSILKNANKYLEGCIPDLVRRKESNWRYEKEKRVYLDFNGEYIELPASSIREIYLGLRSDEATKLTAECIKQREEYKHLKIYKMNKHKSAYKLVPEEII